MEKNNLESNNEIQSSENTTKSKISLPTAVIFSAIVISSAIFITRSPEKINTTEGGQSELEIITNITEKDFIRGNPDAEVTVIEYADFSCGFCGVYHPTLKKLVEEYDGKVRWIYRHLPIFNPEAALASQCVGNIGGGDKFWQFADTMFLNREKYSNEYYKNLAIDLGINEQEYLSCIENQVLKSEIQRDFTRLKILFGINATPHTVIFNDQGKEFSFAGALPYEDVKFVIDGLLN